MAGVCTAVDASLMLCTEAVVSALERGKGTSVAEGDSGLGNDSDICSCVMWAFGGIVNGGGCGRL